MRNYTKRTSDKLTKIKSATTPGTMRETTKGQKDEKESTMTPRPRKRLGSKITSFKKANHKSNNRRACKVKKEKNL